MSNISAPPQERWSKEGKEVMTLAPFNGETKVSLPIYRPYNSKH